MILIKLNLKKKVKGEVLDGLRKERLAKRQKFLRSLKTKKRLRLNRLQLLLKLLPNQVRLLPKWIFLLNRTLLLTKIRLNLWTFLLTQRLLLKKTHQKKRVLLTKDPQKRVLPIPRKKKKVHLEVV
jgi:hypothetical protein